MTLKPLPTAYIETSENIGRVNHRHKYKNKTTYHCMYTSALGLYVHKCTRIKSKGSPHWPNSKIHGW